MDVDSAGDQRDDFELDLRRLEDLHDIRNLMGRRAFVHSAGHNDQEVEQFWATAPDVSFEPEDWGIWHGREHLYEVYVDGNPFPNGVPGLMIEHCLTTAVIEVADDGLTAQGMWISPGHETFPIVEGAPPKPHWSWGRYAVDFIKEDGSWRIWHLHVLTTFRTPYDVDWVTSSIHRPAYFPEVGEVMPGMPRPDGPVTYNQPYSLRVVPTLEPPLPRSHPSWDPAYSYGSTVPAGAGRTTTEGVS